jgi:N-methylhydantoinase A
MTDFGAHKMQISVDVGGTFTDLVAHHEDGTIAGYKTPSTRPDIIEGFFDGLGLIAAENGLTLEDLMPRIQRINFGTTAATNAILEGKAARTALLTTRGFRDTLLIREGGKDASYDLQAPYPQPYVPRSLTFEIDERMTAEGVIHRPLNEESVRNAITMLKEKEVEAVVISLLWSIANPAHELRAAEMVRAELPEIALSLGHEVNPCVREYRRTISAAIDASLKPLVRSNVEKLERLMKEYHFQGKLTYITSTGGKASGSEVVQRPVYLCYSGPSAAPVAGQRFAQMEGFTEGNVLTVDMGGTSFDVSIVTNGKLLTHREGSIAGHLFGVPSVEIHSIGSGGGSIARVDAGGFLHVGPESAGSRPGPACYERNGTQPTVTDANLVLGILNDTFSSGSGMSLNRDLAAAALETIASPMGLSNDEAAALITHTCEQDMVGAMEALTIERGIDPRQYVLVAGGAAMGAHAVSIAKEIGIKKVIVPRMAGVLSAFGILAGELSFNFARSFFTSSDNFDAAGVETAIDQLTEEGRRFLDEMSVPEELQILEFSCETRYRRQVWQLTLPFDPSGLTAADGIRNLMTAFHKLHHFSYGSSSEGDVIEFTEWNVRARGQVDDVTLPEISGPEKRIGPSSIRSVYFKQLRKRIDVPVYGPLSLPIEEDIEGPLLIDEHLTTIVIEPGVQIRLSALGNYVIDVSSAADQYGTAADTTGSKDASRFLEPA